ncbi:hypothetical protein [uncultured Rubinisphaera sp.]
MAILNDCMFLIELGFVGKRGMLEKQLAQMAQITPTYEWRRRPGS